MTNSFSSLVSSALRAVALPTLVVAAGCAPHADHASHVGHPNHVDEEAHRGHAELPPGEFAADSIFHLETEWRNADGEAVSLARALGGKPAVAAMIYTSCEHACPVIVADMMKIRQAMADGVDEVDGNDGAAEAGAVRYVLFSFDPERDTPQRVGEYRARQSLNGWTILAPADLGAERELAAALGVRFKPIPGGDFAHSNIIFILDAEGAPRHRQVGLLQAPDESAAVLRQLLQRQ